MRNDCACKRCQVQLETIPNRVTATQTIYEQDGKPVARKGDAGNVEDRDISDNWLIVTFGDREPTICYPHEVR